MGSMDEHTRRTYYRSAFLGPGVLILLYLLPLLVSSRFVFFFAEVIIYALFAISFNLMLGHTGMLSFGHAAFFGIGAYTYALLVKKAMLPFGVALGAVLPVGMLSSLIIGYFCVRHTRIYFAFLTFAFCQMVFVIIHSMYDLTGGDDGLIGVPVLRGLGSTINAYYFILTISVICSLLLLRITNSPFGSVLRSIRDNPERVEFSGLKIRRFRLASFVIAGFFIAVAGALYTILTKAAFVEYLGMEIGVLTLFACLLGGMHTFYGPVIGALIVVALDKLVGAYTLYWSAVMGAAVIFIVIVFPKGILGFLNQRFSTRTTKEVISKRIAAHEYDPQNGTLE